MISRQLVSARILFSIWKRSSSVAVDTPSTSSQTVAPKNGHFVPYSEYVAKLFPEQLAALDRHLQNAEFRRKANFNPHKYDRVIKLIHEKVTRNCRLVPVGSSASALITDSSDLDLVFFQLDEACRRDFVYDFSRNIDFREVFMKLVASLVQRTLAEEGLEVVYSTILPGIRVPLIRMEINNETQIDIQFPYTDQSLRNTHLIKMYSDLDDRFPQLFIWIKRLLDVLEVRDSANSLLSTYHILLLTIHFLQSEQCHSPWPVLPVLCKTHSHIVGRGVPIQNIIESLESPDFPNFEWKSNNKMPVSELAVRFIDYYYNFNAAADAIFISSGLTQRRKQTAAGEIQLQLFDPYSAKSVCQSYNALNAFKEAVSFIRKKIKTGQMLDTFPEFPEAKLFKEATKWSTWRLRAAELRHYNMSIRQKTEQMLVDED